MNSRVASLMTAAVFVLLPAMAHAIPIVGTGALGSFSGSFEYDATLGRVDVSLTNTSPVAGGGYITAFVFNVPAGASVSSVVLSSSDPDFGVIGGPTFGNGINGGPYGRFDIGASTSSSFEGGGMPSVGIGVGAMATFSFTLTGTGLSGLTAEDFLGTVSVPPGAGEGVEEMVVRFRGFSPSGSDKVPAEVPPTSVPEPATLLLLGLGLSALGSRRFRSPR